MVLGLEQATCSMCEKEEDKYWIDKYGMCFWCHEKENDRKFLERTQKEAVKNGETSNEDYIICPYCGCKCSEDELYESTDTYCDECEKEFHLEVEHTPTYSTSKINDALSEKKE